MIFSANFVAVIICLQTKGVPYTYFWARMTLPDSLWMLQYICSNLLGKRMFDIYAWQSFVGPRSLLHGDWKTHRLSGIPTKTMQLCWKCSCKRQLTLAAPLQMVIGCNDNMRMRIQSAWISWNSPANSRIRMDLICQHALGGAEKFVLSFMDYLLKRNATCILLWEIGEAQDKLQSLQIHQRKLNEFSSMLLLC